MSKRKIQVGKYYSFKFGDYDFYKVKMLVGNSSVKVEEINIHSGEVMDRIIPIASLGREIAKSKIEGIKMKTKANVIDRTARLIIKISLF